MFQGLGFRVKSSGFMVKGLGFRVYGLRFRIWASGFSTGGVDVHGIIKRLGSEHRVGVVKRDLEGPPLGQRNHARGQPCQRVSN